MHPCPLRFTHFRDKGARHLNEGDQTLTLLRMDCGTFLSALWHLDCLLYGYGIVRMWVAIPGMLL